MNTYRIAENRTDVSILITFLAALTVFAFGAVPTLAATRVEVKTMVVEEANNSRVPPSLALAVAKVESDFQPRALSSAGARGVMQIMPATAMGEYGVDPDETWDARLNIQLGIDFLERLIERYDGRWDLALSHYNGGSVRGNMPNADVLPATRKYVEAVLRWQKRYAEQAAVWLADDIPSEGWQSAHTRAVVTAVMVGSRQSIENARIGWVPVIETVARDWNIGTWRSSARGFLDDFDGGMEMRRILARSRLDDYSPKITWNGG